MASGGRQSIDGDAVCPNAYAGPCPACSGGCLAEMWKRKFEEEHEKRVTLLEVIAERGIINHELLSEADQDRITIMLYLRRNHRSIRISPRKLSALPDSIRQEVRDYMYVVLGNDLRAKPRINEALGKGKRSKRRDDRGKCF